MIRFLVGEWTVELRLHFVQTTTGIGQPTPKVKSLITRATVGTPIERTVTIVTVTQPNISLVESEEFWGSRKSNGAKQTT